LDSNNLDLPGEDDYNDEPSKRTGARRRWPWAVGAVALVAAAFAGGVAVAGNLGAADSATTAGSTDSVSAPAASPSLTTPPSPTVATSASVPTAPPSAAATTPPAASWQTFTSADGKVSFEHPGAWHVSPTPESSAYAGTSVDVADEAGVVVASMTYGPSGGLGGACQGAVPYTVLDSVEVNIPHQASKGSVTPRFAFRALQEADHVTASYGLTNSVAGQNGTTCMFYNVVTDSANPPMYSFADAFSVRVGDSQQTPNRKGVKTFPSMDAARDYMQTPEYLNAKRMITSLKITAG
jgi:hypothetical protein